jgi:hypothetical protein
MAAPQPYEGAVRTDRSTDNPSFWTQDGRRLLAVGGKHYLWNEAVKYANSIEHNDLYYSAEGTSPWWDALGSQGTNSR